MLDRELCVFVNGEAIFFCCYMVKLWFTSLNRLYNQINRDLGVKILHA